MHAAQPAIGPAGVPAAPSPAIGAAPPGELRAAARGLGGTRATAAVTVARAIGNTLALGARRRRTRPGRRADVAAQAGRRPDDRRSRGRHRQVPRRRRQHRPDRFRAARLHGRGRAAALRRRLAADPRGRLRPVYRRRAVQLAREPVPLSRLPDRGGHSQMSPQSGPPWMSGQSWTGGYHARRSGPANPDIRVSDAERTEVADRLSKHYGDGRLDQSEFNERMERAMSAKTQGDFAGLFADLP